MNNSQRSDYKRKFILLVIIVSLVKWIIAASTELGNDEAYYWLYSQQLQWNYFDHPPMVAVWIRIFSANLLFENYEGFIRLGSVVGSSLSSWFMFRMVSEIHSERAGFFTGSLYLSSIYAGITAGLYILPDSPQMVFWTFSLWMVTRILRGDERWINWIMLGLASGLCIMSKVHGVFIWLGFGSYILIHKRSWLTRPQLYISLLITFVIISPIIFWNLQNDFISYRFHSNRVTIHQFHPKHFFQEILVQIFFNNPFNVLLIITGIAALKNLLKKFPVLKIFPFIGLPLPIILLFISLTRETLPHWNGPGYISLLPIAAIALAEKKIHYEIPNLVKASMGFFFLIILAGTCMIKFFPGTLGKTSKTHLGSGDPTLDMFGWKEAGEEFNQFYQEGIRQEKIAKGTPVVCLAWPGAHVEYYFCKPGNIPMIPLGKTEDLHQYAWMKRNTEIKINMQEAFYITRSDEKGNYLPSLNKYFNKVEKLKVIETMRNGKPAHDFIIYKLSEKKF